MFATDGRAQRGPPMRARWTLDRSSGRLVETILDERARISGGSTAPSRGVPTVTVTPRTRRLCIYRAGRQARPDGAVRGRPLRPRARHARAGLRPGQFAVAEDEGCILSYVYDAGRDRSDVVDLDAGDFGGIRSRPSVCPSASPTASTAAGRPTAPPSRRSPNRTAPEIPAAPISSRDRGPARLGLRRLCALLTTGRGGSPCGGCPYRAGRPGWRSGSP